MFSEKKEWYEDKITNLVKKYFQSAKFDEMVNLINKKSVMDVRYARGGDSLPRGIYNRLILHEIGFKNSGRGKFLIRESQKNQIIHIILKKKN